jgi:hypothetical protein
VSRSDWKNLVGFASDSAPRRRVPHQRPVLNQALQQPVRYHDQRSQTSRYSTEYRRAIKNYKELFCSFSSMLSILRADAIKLGQVSSCDRRERRNMKAKIRWPVFLELLTTRLFMHLLLRGHRSSEVYNTDVVMGGLQQPRTVQASIYSLPHAPASNEQKRPI